MTERKQRYRIPPCAAYDIPAMESWLEDMAAKGLHLAKDGFFMGYATFEVGPPRRERFRLEATDTNGGLFSEEYAPDDDAVQLLHQMGWTHRARRGQFHIYSTADPNAPELNTDPQVQAITMAALSKLQRKTFVTALIWLAFYTMLYWRKILLTSAILLGSWLAVLFGGLMFWKLLREIRTMAVLSRYRKQLQAGELLPHRSDYRRQGIRYLAAGGVRKVLWFVLIVSVLIRLSPMMSDDAYVSLDSREFPFATLEDIFPDARIERKDWMLKSEVYSWEDPISPENYDFSELADVAMDGKVYTCYLSVQYHRTCAPWAAKLLARELVSQAADDFLDRTLGRLFGNEPVIMTPIEGTGADFCVYYRVGVPDPYLIIRMDNVVIRARYAPMGEGPRIPPEELADIILSHLH